MTQNALAPLLKVDRLTKTFGGILAADDVSFEVASDSITAIIGPNGAGKTTIFNLITGFYQPSSGRVLLNGNDITGGQPDRNAECGLIRTFQLVRPFAQMTAFENVLAGFHLQTRGDVFSAIVKPKWVRNQERQIQAKANELLEFVGLHAQRNTQARNLTYGQQRRLEIARALAAKPKLLMLDEPAAGLTTPETAQLATIIQAIRQRGPAILLIEHDIELVMGIAHSVCVLDFGRVIAQGTPTQVQRNQNVIDAYLGPNVAHV
jgi:branched-chain amino acid transport system ATP-binding protein